MENPNYQFSEKQKMLAFGLKARGVKQENILHILMVLEDDDQVDDLVWFMGENPEASEELLVSVAYQLVKDAHEGK